MSPNFANSKIIYIERNNFKWKNMKIKLIFCLANIMLIIINVIVFSPVIVKAAEILVWQGDVSSDGTPVDTLPIILEYGEVYRIVASEVFKYQLSPDAKEADAQYYTTTTDTWNWGSYSTLPGGHSFLQINDGDVNWGPFSNGDTGHTYSIYYTGEGAQITFKIHDWIDENYENNICLLTVKIYWVPSVGGKIVGSNILKAVPLLTVCAFTVALLTTGRIIKIRRNYTR